MFICPTIRPTETFIGILHELTGATPNTALPLCHTGVWAQTSIVAALAEIGRGLINTLLPLGELPQSLQ